LLKTQSSIISFYEDMEDKISEYYEFLGKHLTEKESEFQKLAKESTRFKRWVKRAYQEGVTDAFEVSYANGEIEKDSYKIDINPPEKIDRTRLVKKAIDIEKTSRNFCLDAANSSGGALSELPHVLERVAMRKSKRIEKLRSLL